MVRGLVRIAGHVDRKITVINAVLALVHHDHVMAGPRVVMSDIFLDDLVARGLGQPAFR